ncbi:MAG: hypothetical protein R3B95_20960 [Nitrospirales bacterium]|nr:hypothetical protein [Nitrospirales bacterium]
MSRNADVGLADFLLSLEALRPSFSDVRTRQTIAKVLGLTWTPPVSLKKSMKHRSRKMAESASSQATQSDQISTNLTEKTEPSVPFELEYFTENTDETEDEIAEWLANVVPINKPSKKRFSPGATPPLFRPGWERGILQAAFSIQVPEGSIIVEDVVGAMARGKYLKTIPRTMLYTVRQGVHLLLDQSRSFAPFQNDLSQIKEAILRLIPEDRCTFWNFVECPVRGVRQPGKRHSQPFSFPSQKQVVVVITDLGLMGSVGESNPGTEDEWVTFGQGVRKANCPLVAFTPFPPERIPPTIRSVMSPILWDKPTTITDVFRERRNEKWP